MACAVLRWKADSLFNRIISITIQIGVKLDLPILPLTSATSDPLHPHLKAAPDAWQPARVQRERRRGKSWLGALCRPLECDIEREGALSVVEGGMGAGEAECR